MVALNMLTTKLMDMKVMLLMLHMKELLCILMRLLQLYMLLQLPLMLVRRGDGNTRTGPKTKTIQERTITKRNSKRLKTRQLNYLYLLLIKLKIKYLLSIKK